MAENESGTYVERDGLAVVHRGEKIVAAPDSAAILSTGYGAETHYHFPVHVVMVGDIGEDVKRELEARIWDGLHDALA